MRHFDFIEVIVKDGNRTVSRMFPDISTVEDVLARYELKYKKCRRDKVSIDGRMITPDLLDCQLNYFKIKGRKLHIRVESILKQFKTANKQEVKANG